jgi:hypothetical protein
LEAQIMSAVTKTFTGIALFAAIAGQAAVAGDFDSGVPLFLPGNLVLSRTVYDNNANNVTVGEPLPPNCPPASGACGAASGAPDDGTYPFVFNNALFDGSFGITSRILLDQVTLFGLTISTLEVPNSLQHGITSSSDQMVTSFSSKSELALNLSTDHRQLTFMGYVAPVNAIDVSNSNTPAVVDPTNPVGENVVRAVAQMDAFGHLAFTETNAYSGNNGRAAIFDNSSGADEIFTAGNAGNGGNPQPVGVIIGAGAQVITPANAPEAAQSPGLPTPVASFSVTELGDKADKVGKDTNFRGLTIFNNVLYYSKGSGGNGVDTVYFVDTTGTACPNGVGVPAAGASLPAMALTVPASVQKTGLPNNMCILSGFPTNLAKTATLFPFGIWFADANTVYVADEGDGVDTVNADNTLFTDAAAQTTAGLQKWVFNASTQSWSLAYVLQTGLNLGVPYTVAGYPSGINAATGLPWSPATDGLRNLTGKIEGNRVFIWAITSTVSGSGDQGADPNKLVVIEDSLANTDPAVAATESFFTLRTAQFGEALRGISFTPSLF